MGVHQETVKKVRSSEGAGYPVERPLTISNVLLDGCDLFVELHGCGHPKRSRKRHPATFNAQVHGARHVTISHTLSVKHPGGGSLFDPSLTFWRRAAVAMLVGICGGMWVYAIVDSQYRVGALIGRILLRQAALKSPPNSRRPWFSTLIHEFWSFRWHQLYRRFRGASRRGTLRTTWFPDLNWRIHRICHYASCWHMGTQVIGLSSPPQEVFSSLWVLALSWKAHSKR
ncbi:hypothetical protein B0F90DRAFT_1870970 [Multifurca ochricompacta]|uniref:Uncharacterized protein n=1 Tax=Multifurca ochricompacta TaxID=376703 RepID=A0AAD4QLZ4_9AGAM|nr:hypothetical protein B0F90DRAFT_1870970 [Multifurca ochricompacta]